LVSVVVPVYEGEDYLAECLDSLLRQSYRRIQVVVVDDGSTDHSAGIAREYADRDDRVVLVGQAHAGLGAARNTGLRRCDGELITFADADDTVAQDAYRRMVRTLQRSGSDFVVGAVVRSRRGGYQMRRWVRMLHERRRLGVRIEDAPGMLANVMPWSKLFRRDFLERLDLRFPEGILYEDQIPMTRAYLEARAFDVIPEVVYRWRLRADGNSITQRKSELQNLLDRVAVQREIAAMLRRSAAPAVERWWYIKTFRGDVPSYAKASVSADGTYWATFRDGVIGLLADAPADLYDQLRRPLRLATWLIEHDHREALVSLLAGDGLAARERGSAWRRTTHAPVDLGTAQPDIPDDVLRLRPVDVAIRSRLARLERVQTGRLTVTSLVSVAHPEVLGDRLRHRLDLVRVDVGGEGCLTVPGISGSDDDTSGVKDWHPVVAEIDVGALVEASSGSPVAKWALYPTAGGKDTQVVSRLHHHSGRRLVEGLGPEIVSGALVRAHWSEVNGVMLVVRHRYAVLLRAEGDPDGVTLDVRVRGLRKVDRIHVGEGVVPVTMLEPATPGTVRLRVSASDLPSPALVWIASARRSAPLLAPPSDPPVVIGGSAVTVDRRGRVLLGRTPSSPEHGDRDPGDDLFLVTAPD
jgi:glycosyltransferase involved in cell wall biosynthesis